MNTTKQNKSTSETVLPLIPMRGLVVFPGNLFSFDIGRKSSKEALAHAMQFDQKIFLVAQKNSDEENPKPADLYSVGVIARIRQILEVSSDLQKITVETLTRAKVIKITQEKPFFLTKTKAFLDEIPNPANTEYQLELESKKRFISSLLEQYSASSAKMAPDTLNALMQIESFSRFVNIVAHNIFFSLENKQKLLEYFSLNEQMDLLISTIQQEIQLIDLQNKLENKVHSSIEQNQKEYFLREQINAIRNELGEHKPIEEDLEFFKSKLKESNIPAEFHKKIEKEIARYSQLPDNFPEASILKTWLTTLFDLPFGKYSEEKSNLPLSRRILDRDHYGLEKVKERILEYLAVRKLQIEAGELNHKGPILCLVGPPGVGKTSIAKAIAEAMGRKYVRMSLGGIRDEAEIRGHRRTYIGAMPGRIIHALTQAGTDNPVILLDEIDKLGNDYKGDPSSALLEVLDPEQNFSFRDHYLEIPYDLSRVLFLTTSNNMETIPLPLLDRMEIIELPGYTSEEKFEIAKRHLLPQQLKIHALRKTDLSLNKPAFLTIINQYTMEAGVRQLERELAHLCRRIAVKLGEAMDEKLAEKVKNEKKRDELRKKLTPFKISEKILADYIGKAKFNHDKIEKENRIGVATGLAWTYAGGATLSIEVNVMPGTGKLELTGRLGNVMQESAKAAFSYIRSRAEKLSLAKDFAQKYDIHIHVPAGATPKDGPSAGITLATAMASALCDRAVHHDLAMTGEVTLRGRVMPIGGLKEKAIAAQRAGIHKILIPEDNRRDIEDIPESVRKKLEILPVKTMDEVLAAAFVLKT